MPKFRMLSILYFIPARKANDWKQFRGLPNMTLLLIELLASWIVTCLEIKK